MDVSNGSDIYSKWPEVCMMVSTTAETTMKQLQQIFATHGLPLQIVTDIMVHSLMWIDFNSFVCCVDILTLHGPYLGAVTVKLPFSIMVELQCVVSTVNISIGNAQLWGFIEKWQCVPSYIYWLNLGQKVISSLYNTYVG